MKIFQIVDGFCWWDATDTVKTLKGASEMFAPDMIFVETPDFVREGWAYDEHAKGDDRFLRPEAPEGYEYDDETGTFYSLSTGKNSMTNAARLAILIDQMTAMIKEAETLLAALSGEGPKEEQKEEHK